MQSCYKSFAWIALGNALVWNVKISLLLINSSCDWPIFSLSPEQVPDILKFKIL